jgi:hypothetical protein
MQLVVLWKFGGLVVEPGHTFTDFNAVLWNNNNNKQGGEQVVACSNEHAHGFSLLYSSLPRNKVVVESLMQNLLDAYAWNVLKKLNAKTKDQDVPAKPSQWPVTLDWNTRLQRTLYQYSGLFVVPTCSNLSGWWTWTKVFLWYFGV